MGNIIKSDPTIATIVDYVQALLESSSRPVIGPSEYQIQWRSS